MKRIATTLCLVLATGLPAYSAPPASTTNNDNDAKPAAHQSHDDAYLGVLVMPLHPGFASHLKGLSRGQGLMVAEVAPDSPAAKAEIKTHDILVAFDDQKLFSAEQMAKLIHADKPGREVSVELIRDGQSQKIKATLGKLDHRRHNEWMQAMEEQAFHHGHLNRFHHTADSHEPSGTDWKDFDSLTIKKLADDKFHVDIQFLGKDNKNHKHEFEGTRDELRKAIRSEQDLKPVERAHLLRSLNMSTSDEGFFGPGARRSDDQKEGT